MTGKASSRLSIGAVILSIVVPMANKALDTGGKIIESRFVKVASDAKSESDFKDEIILNLIERVSTLEKAIK